MYIPKLRKLNQVLEIMKREDENTVITYNLLEHLIKTKQIGAVKFGTTWIVNLDEVYSYFTKEKKE